MKKFTFDMELNSEVLYKLILSIRASSCSFKTLSLTWTGIDISCLVPLKSDSHHPKKFVLFASMEVL